MQLVLNSANNIHLLTLNLATEKGVSEYNSPMTQNQPSPDKSDQNNVILVTGATGYIGGRLVPRLLELGYRVRCLARDPSRLQGRPWLELVEIVAGDVLQPESLAPRL